MTRKNKPTPQVHLVVDCHNSPGKVLAVFASGDDAERFASCMPGEAEVESRTLFYGQPGIRGFNK